MRAAIYSDLHIEFLAHRRKEYVENNGDLFQGELPELDTDVLILAGDIHKGKKGIKWARRQADRSGIEHIIYVAGNHEHYGSDIRKNLNYMRESAKKHDVHFLENDEITIGGVRFLGATLWTDYSVAGMDRRVVMNICQENLNDHYVIRYGADEFFTVEHALKIHRKSVEWLDLKLHEKDIDATATVVVTHHAPSLKCQHQKYPVGPITGAFLSELDHLVEKADLWIFGHSHFNVDIEIDGCRVVSNQAGYYFENVGNFDLYKVIEL